MAGSLGDLGSADRYAYANDDPVNLVDTSGKDAIACFAALFTLATAGPTISSWIQGILSTGWGIIQFGAEIIERGPEFFEIGGWIALFGFGVIVIGTFLIAAGIYFTIAVACGLPPY